MTDATTEPAETDEISYAEAMDELDEIVTELESDDADIDVLAERVERAAELVALCRARLQRAKVRVDEIVTDLDALDGDDDADA